MNTFWTHIEQMIGHILDTQIEQMSQEEKKGMSTQGKYQI